MKKKRFFIFLAIASFLVVLNRGFIIAQEEESQEVLPADLAEVEWIGGDVVSVDVSNKLLVVKYLDYETETEKEMSINVDEKTVLENVKSLEEIKPQDTVSIDYVVSIDGKNIAKNIILEKIEDEDIPSIKETEEIFKE